MPARAYRTKTTVNVRTAAKVLGIGVPRAYDMMREGTMPGQIKNGKTYGMQVSIYGLARYLGASVDEIRGVIAEIDAAKLERVG